MAGEHDLDSGIELVGLTLKVGTGAALGFRGVAGKFDAIDGEHLATDQTLPVADGEHWGEQVGNVVANGTDKVGQRGEVRGLIAGQGDEGDVVAAGALDLAAADDALRIGEQDDLEQNGRRVRGGTGGVVLVAAVEAGEVEFVVDQMI